MTHPVEIFDVTIRDGSYAVDFQFNADDIRFLYPILERIGFNYIEIGHGLGLDASAVNRAAASDSEYLAAASKVRTKSKFGTFFIPGIGAKDSLRRAREEFGMDFIRIGRDASKMEDVLSYVSHAKDLGYEVMCNFMKSYTISPAELAKKSKLLGEHGADVVYVVDSAGGMMPNEVADYFKALSDTVDLRTGFHAHNNLELAGANCLVAQEHGCTLLDCSIGGLGRSAGNARTELLIPALAANGVKTDYDFLEVLRVWEQLIAPILRRRTLGPTQVAGGYALVHSGLIGPFVEQAEEKGLRLEALLAAYADASRVAGAPEVDLPSFASELAKDVRTRKFSNSAPNALLSVGLEQREPHRIRNSFRSVRDVFDAAYSLSCKSYLPTVLLVNVEPSAPEEAFVAAEYVFHDEHHIVINVLVSSTQAFLEAFRECGEHIDTIVLNAPTQTVLDQLAQAGDWSQGKQVLSLDLTSLRARHFMTVVNQLVLQTGGSSVLVYGGFTARLAEYANGTRASFHRAVAKPYQQLGIEPVGFGPASETPETFSLVALLSPPSASDLQALRARLEPGGVLVDFARCLDGEGPERFLSVQLDKAVSGELLKLRDLELAPLTAESVA